ncbi:MAG: ATP-binding protein, partial [Candidatus Thermoplasmatota archaeon]|nr:ATP-binding protein [Candidatus Thermoplasmatota archaeon]
IFQNLLANAAKYGGGGADPIEVTAERIPGAWRFAVRDHGPGIPEVHQDRIFDIFHRVEPEGGQVGSGIGLAVVQRLVNRHGGQVWVESEPGEGACFYFTLPDRTDHGAQT